ncbi:MAG: hypothetical protein GY898_11230 [Proteobacteria bacterium]|nr:hypothetical protein [Pseudomonadota bacterium]
MGHGRAATEGGLLTALATILVWMLSLLPVEVPPAVAGAFSGLVVAIGTLAFSEWRNNQYNTRILGSGGLVLVLPLLLVVGCVTWAGDRYQALAGPEIIALLDATDAEPLDPARCAAHKDAAKALRDEEAGTAKSLNAPFFAGQHIGELAGRHDRMGSYCYEMADRDRARGVLPALRGELRTDWVTAWRDGRALQGGPEGEE